MDTGKIKRYLQVSTEKVKQFLREVKTELKKVTLASEDRKRLLHIDLIGNCDHYCYLLA